MTTSNLNSDNYFTSAYMFRDRQAGVSVIFDPEQDQFVYNAYCLEKKLLKELVSHEFSYLDDALTFVNNEYGNWELQEVLEKDTSKGCGSCAAKR